MYKFLLYLSLFILSANISWAQYAMLNDTKPAPGKRLDIKTYCNQELEFKDSIHRKATFRKLQQYISKRVNWKHLEKIRGVIYLEVTIDAIGNPCCIRATHNTLNTNEEIKLLGLPDIINSMPQWRPAIYKSEPTNSTRIIGIYCHVEGREVFEVKYYSKYKDRKIQVMNAERTLLNLDWDELADNGE